MPDKPAEVMRTWGFNAQTLLSFVANMTDSEKDELVGLLWPAIAKRLNPPSEYKFVDKYGNYDIDTRRSNPDPQ